MTVEFKATPLRVLNLLLHSGARPFRLEGRSMKKVRRLLVIPMMFVMLAAGVASAAQSQHVVSPKQLAQTTAQRAAAQDADRAAVREALGRPDVKRVADSMGLDTQRLADAVGTMTGDDLAQAGATARQVNDQLVGGDVVISSTVIIIALLVIILIIVAT